MRPHLCARTFAPAPMRPHLCAHTYAPSHMFQHLCSRTFAPARLRPHVCARTFAPAHLRPHVCARTFAPARLRPHVCARTFAPAHLRPHVCARTFAPAHLRPHVCARTFAPALMHPHVRSSNHMLSATLLKIFIGVAVGLKGMFDVVWRGVKRGSLLEVEKKMKKIFFVLFVFSAQLENLVPGQETFSSYNLPELLKTGKNAITSFNRPSGGLSLVVFGQIFCLWVREVEHLKKLKSGSNPHS
jgi:hypothetical protein